MSGTLAVVAGATGLTGQYLLNVLAEDSFYDGVTALVRRPAIWESPRIRGVPADYEDLTAEDLAGATHLFCCLGTTIRKAGSREAFRNVDLDFSLAFARAGHAAGARRMMLVSSVGADARSSNFYLSVKGELEAEVRHLRWEGLYIFRPSLLMGRRQEKRPAEEWGARLARAFEWTLAGSLRKYRPMPVGTLAAAMAAAGERGAPGTHVLHYDEIVAMSGG
jgi:uncharacterized protein YbjT (DUF2867 family)